MAQPIRITVFPTDRAAARAIALQLADSIASHPSTVLGLPTGRTPIRLYHELASLASRGRVNLAQVRTFNLDEFLGVEPSAAGSYRQFMEKHLFQPAGIRPEHVEFLNGATDDPQTECERYESAIEAAGGIDIQILGIGTNGHIGFNEPGRELQPRTHRVTLKAETRRSNAALFGGNVDAVPAEALSMGMATILRARSIVLLATGRSKASCVGRAVTGPITTRLPASFLQLHHDVQLVLDEAAAGKLAEERVIRAAG